MVSFFIFQANGQAKITANCLKITESTVQVWSPGMAQAGEKKAGGKIYQIVGMLKKSGDLTFDSLFIDGRSIGVEVIKGNDRAYKGTFKKGDTITILARQDKGNRYFKSSDDVSALISSEANTSAFISIWLNGKRYLHPIAEFKDKAGHTLNQ
ncbi:MAG: hypothetical protein JJE09_14655 [Bacteroidia bacterium]|nr:hypothetical protein [Bacteroidia bacterium]